MPTKKQKKNKKTNKVKNTKNETLNRKGLKREKADTVEPIVRETKLLKTSQKQQDVSNVTSFEKPKLSGVEFAELKQRLRERKKLLIRCPLLCLREFGLNASLDIPIDDRIPLFVSDIQHLILMSQLGFKSPYSASRWCTIEKQNRLTSMNVLIFDNLSILDFVNHENMFPFLKQRFSFKLEVVASSAYGSDTIKDLSMVPLTRTQARIFTHKFGSIENAVQKSDEIFDTFKNSFPIQNGCGQQINYSHLPVSDKFPRTQLLLSGWQMIEENYPLPIKGLCERKYVDYKLTKDKYKPVTVTSPMFALDCEMCLTAIGDNELTRISIVDEQHNVIYDTLVKPYNRIVNYLTRFSGITPKMMRDVTKRLDHVQEDLRQLLPDDAILIGQGLNNDMHAMKMMHPYIIDTSVIFNITGERSRKTKLAVLSNQFLEERIQENSAGHCSSEDSLACMKLVQLKLENNLYFGDAVMGGVFNECSTHPDLETPQYATSLLKHVTKFDNKVTIVANSDLCKKYNHYLDKNSDANAKNSLKNIEFVVGQKGDDVIKLACEQISGQSSLNLTHIDVDNESINNRKCIDDWINKYYESTRNNGLTCVLFGGKHNIGNGVCFLEMKKDITIN